MATPYEDDRCTTTGTANLIGSTQHSHRELSLLAAMEHIAMDLVVTYIYGLAMHESLEVQGLLGNNGPLYLQHGAKTSTLPLET